MSSPALRLPVPLLNAPLGAPGLLPARTHQKPRWSGALPPSSVGSAGSPIQRWLPAYGPSASLPGAELKTNRILSRLCLRPLQWLLVALGCCLNNLVWYPFSPITLGTLRSNQPILQLPGHALPSHLWAFAPGTPLPSSHPLYWPTYISSGKHFLKAETELGGCPHCASAAWSLHFLARVCPETTLEAAPCCAVAAAKLLMGFPPGHR